MNRLYYGDNKTIMQTNMKLSSVDLIYLDPPFNSKKDYNLLYKKLTGKPVPEQAEAFTDTWTMDAQKDEIARTMPVLMRERGVDDAFVNVWRLWMQALRSSNPQLLAYLIYMVERLVYMKSILKPTGSIYLHCDPAASHYIKVLMDAIFGHTNFRNEIIWKRTSAHSSSRRWGPVHDVILFYSMSDKYTWNPQYQGYAENYVKDFYRHSDERGQYRLGDLTGAGVRTGESGEPWRDVDPTEAGRHWATPSKVLVSLFGEESTRWNVRKKLDALDAAGLIYWPKRGRVPQFKRYLGEQLGVPLQDVLIDIKPIGSQADERLGYQTQKPVELLERIIRASSNPGDTVFDPFCGCGTTIYASEKCGRKWIGCDIAILSIRLIIDRLKSQNLVEGVHFEVDGIPVSVEQASVLAKKDPYQFQHWFVEKVGGFPTIKRSNDLGIDGKVYFETNSGLKEMVLSVKGGNIRPADIRDLRGVLERESNALLAGFLSLKEATKAMKLDAAHAGMFAYQGVNYPRIQLLSAQDVLEDKKTLVAPSIVGSRLKSQQGSLGF